MTLFTVLKQRKLLLRNHYTIIIKLNIILSCVIYINVYFVKHYILNVGKRGKNKLIFIFFIETIELIEAKNTRKEWKSQNEIFGQQYDKSNQC